MKNAYMSALLLILALLCITPSPAAAETANQHIKLKLNPEISLDLPADWQVAPSPRRELLFAAMSGTKHDILNILLLQDATIQNDVQLFLDTAASPGGELEAAKLFHPGFTEALAPYGLTPAAPLKLGEIDGRQGILSRVQGNTDATARTHALTYQILFPDHVIQVVFLRENSDSGELTGEMEAIRDSIRFPAP